MGPVINSEPFTSLNYTWGLFFFFSFFCFLLPRRQSCTAAKNAVGLSSEVLFVSSHWEISSIFVETIIYDKNLWPINNWTQIRNSFNRICIWKEFIRKELCFWMVSTVLQDYIWHEACRCDQGWIYMKPEG
jgi:hypothetical protein